MDLGVSSLQLDETNRDSPTVRMPRSTCGWTLATGESAADLLARAPESELRTILHRFGEERFAARIAREIVRVRADHRVERSGELVDIVRRSIPAAARRHGGNPAKRTFQALRIAVNRELEILAAALPAALDALLPGGRIVVLSTTRSRTGS
jgi:16S rRNA (cytosine1402-N4)-methyltransferase